MSGDKWDDHVDATWNDHVDATWNPRGVTHGMSHVVHFMGPSVKGRKYEKNKEKEIKSRKMERMTSGMGKGGRGGSFPHFDQEG